MTKSPNSRALPLCWDHHVGPEGVEAAGTRNEETWFAKFGIRPFELAAALHANNHSIVAMLKVLAAHKEGYPMVKKNDPCGMHPNRSDVGGCL